MVSSQPLRVFSAALSPDQLPRLSSKELVRTAGVEPTPPEWRSGTLPLSHVRVVRPRGFEPLVGRPADFIDAGFTDRWQERDAKTFVRLRRGFGGQPSPRRLAEGEGVEPSTRGSARFSRPVACHTRHLPNWLSRRDSNARPPPSDGGTLSPLSYGTIDCIGTPSS